MCIDVCVLFVRLCMSPCVSISVCMTVCMSMCVSAPMHVCVSLCNVHVCICVCLCVWYKGEKMVSCREGVCFDGCGCCCGQQNRVVVNHKVHEW